MAPMSTASHHHRSTTKVSHKSFKSRHSTKSFLKDKAKGKIEGLEKGTRKTPHQTMMSKLDRRNQAKQKRLLNNQQHSKATGIFTGKDAAPRIVAVVPLCEGLDIVSAISKLNASADITESVSESGITRVSVERFKQSIAYLTVKRELIPVSDACRLADFVVLVLSAKEEVDGFGEVLIRSIETQGISNVVTVVDNLETIEPAKKRPLVQQSLKSFITHFFPTVERVNSLDNRQECLNLVRSLCTTQPKGIHWREDRSWMMIEEVKWPGGKNAVTEEQEIGEVVLTGIVRGKGLQADRLVQVGDWGDFQIDKITAAPLENRKKVRGEAMAVDTEGQDALLEMPTELQDDLDELAPEETVMEDVDGYAVSMAATERKGVLLDDHHYFSDEETRLPERRAKRIPRGTSKAQAAWYLEDFSDSGSDLEDIDDEHDYGENDGAAGPAEGVFDTNMREPTEGGPSEYPQSEMFLDPSPEDEADQIAAYRSARKEEAEEDLEFPDEIELLPNVSARERLARYRGLKSLRTSAWETEEDRLYEPEAWRRLLEVADYKGARGRVLKESKIGGVPPGTRVNVHLRAVPISLQQTYDPTQPLALYSLLKHEHKRTSVNFSITLSSEEDGPLRSKEELIMQCGPRRFVINPLLSEAGNTQNDVHKFQRYLHPGRTAIASFIGPLTWGSVPTLFFKRSPTTNTLRLVGSGTSLPPSHSRVIAKRVILTGHPFKINKKVVTVRYMFFNSEDVAWFKALQLWTKRGRSGFIKESLGTHGYFKATFDGKINPMDAVAVSLYKRVWPRGAKLWRGLESEKIADESVAVEVEEAPELVEMQVDAVDA
ncbi:pre-rRNA processing protein Tsr1 [Tothia fuscella]|uniref:Pre-rRNA processing protein Tsr1 n=1 Tax=Tothia fuscella TaxID=1048955 RepID=A0A9P4U0V5_9PEZI|nr:pre-rRNA processing protein Tsr1 [Tothia fuscella]